MGSAGRVWISTLVFCLLPACTACSRQRFIARRDPLPLTSIPDTPPVAPGTRYRAEEATYAAEQTTSQAEWIEPAGTMPIHPRRRLAERLACRRPRLWSTCQELRGKLWTDCENYYCWDTTADLLLGIAGASVLGNTSLDHDFRDWYQDDVRSEGSNDFAEVWRRFGDGRYVAPACASMVFVGRMWDESPCGDVLDEFGMRTSRAYLAGTPTLLFFQCCLGGARPGESKYESRWRPFQECHSVSGHGFIGAVPFITAAKMTDDPYLKAGLYACSILPTWSRIDQDGHYLSHAWLGWWMAYLACRAVDNTEHEYEHLTLTPVATPEMVGIGVVYER